MQSNRSRAAWQTHFVSERISSTDQPSALILGDNVFFGTGLPETLQAAASLTDGALVFAYAVRDPERYGVIEFEPGGKVLSLEEKPAHPRSHYAVPRHLLL